MEWAMAPQHPLSKRLVTVHGDLHCENALELGADHGLQCIDFEFSCAAGAYFDLGAAMGQLGWDTSRDQDHRRAFLQAYCEGIGNPLEGDDLDDFLLDVMLAGGFAHFHSKGVLAPWHLKDMERSSIPKMLDAYNRFATLARSDATLRKMVIDK